MTLKIKDTKLFGRTCILDNFIYRESLNYRDLFVNKGSGSGRPKKRPDPTGSGSGSATLQGREQFHPLD